TTVGTQFLPNTDEGFFSIKVELENGAALAETEKVIKEIEKDLQDEEDVETYVSLVGTTQEGSFRGAKNANIAELYVKMKELNNRERSIFEFVDDVKKKIERSAQQANQSAEVSFNVQSSSGSAPNTLTFSVRDSDQDRLVDSVDRIYKSLKDLDDV